MKLVPTSIRRPIITQYIPVLPAGDFNQMGALTHEHTVSKVSTVGALQRYLHYGMPPLDQTHAVGELVRILCMRSSSSRSPFFF